MSRQELNSGSLGDISRMLDTEGVVDLDWLDLTSGENYDNIPSESPREVIPQLQEQWGTEQYSSPFRLVPNAVVPEGSSGKPKGVNEDDIFDVTRVTKKAMMQGKTGNELVGYLRERFDSETLKAASGELKKVAAEDGLLGNVYIDLEPFSDTKEAAIQLGKHRVRLASFAVGKPSRQKDFTDPSGRCRNLGKVAVDQVEYSAEVLAHYETHLKNAGMIGKDETISSKEDLRTAFINARHKRAEAVPEKNENISQNPIDVDKYIKEVSEISKQQEEKSASEVRVARVRPVLAKIQDLMLKGLAGDELKNEVYSCMGKNVIQEFAPEIKDLVSKQGLIGPLVIDVSTYPNVEKAQKAVGRSFMKPKFLYKSMPVEEGFMDKVRNKTGVPVLTGAGDVTPKMAIDIVTALHSSGSIEDEAADSLVESAKEASSNESVEIIKMAMQARSEVKKSKVGRTASNNGSFLYSPATPDRNDLDRGAIKTAAVMSFTKGHKASDVENKIAGYVPIGEAIGIVREAVASMEEIKADSLDKCQSQSYPLAKTASLIAGSKCASCVRNTCNTCTMQSRPFKVASVKKASSFDVDPAVAMQMSRGSIDIDMGSVITPPRNTVDVDMSSASMGDLPS